MNTIKIATMLKKRFSEFFDIKHYGRQASEQLVVKKYSINNRRITINEEK
ncbi:hypothetical protein HYX02_04300 [Candidatus Woesearchaeota archaeon]|nr:hypothetical protein [Candidatus Woesearchaeota archaeon]